MRVSKYLRGRQVTKRATPGERGMGTLFTPNLYGWGGWGQDNLYEQVQHLRQWTYVAVHAICKKVGAAMPNFAYVSDQERPGHTVKASQRGLMNLYGGNFGGSYCVESNGQTFLTVGEYRSKALSVVKPHEHVEPLERDHPLRRLWERPNPYDTSFQFQYELCMFHHLCGSAYPWMVPSMLHDNKPAELWVMPSHWVWPRTGGGNVVSMSPGNGNAAFNAEHKDWWQDSDRIIKYYEIRPWGTVGTAGMLKIPPSDMCMVKWKSPLDKVRGYSPLGAIAQWIDSEESIIKSRWAQFQNIARPDLFIQLGAGYEDATDDQIERTSAKIDQKLRGEYNYGRTMIGTPGMTVTPLSFNPTEMAYFDSDNAMRDCILSALGPVPKSWVGLVEEMTFGSILATLMQFCLDEQTECLTAEGWKRYDELTEQTRVACYDAETGKIVYRNPSKVHVLDYEGDVHKWSSQRIDAVMTPGHRVHVQRFPAAARQHLEYKWETVVVDTLTPATTYRIKRAARAACDAPTKIGVDRYMHGKSNVQELFKTWVDPELWLQFIGYYITEGHLVSRDVRAGWSIGITQAKNSIHTPRIEECLAKMPYHFARRSTGANNWTWETSDKGLYLHLEKHCGARSENKQVPDYVKAWPADALEILLAALVEGDGKDPEVTESTGVWNSSYKTISKQLADDVQEIAVKCGVSAAIAVERDKRNGEMGQPNRHELAYRVGLSTRDVVAVSPQHRTKEHYAGKVWCVTVPTGLFVVRRNGKVHVTGNCEGCLNPYFTMLGQEMTAHLASRWDEETPAWSSQSYGGSGSVRRVKMWWDNCTPADPQQVNNDITVDLQAKAITPNMVLAMRGRPPYKHGGDDPMGSAGDVPIPLNTGDDLEDLAKLMAPMEDPKQNLEAAAEATEEGVTAGGKKDGDQTGSGGGGVSGGDPAAQGDPLEQPDLTDPSVDKPNGKPKKNWTSWYRKEASVLKAPGQGATFPTTDEAIAYAVSEANKAQTSASPLRIDSGERYGEAFAQSGDVWIEVMWAMSSGGSGKEFNGRVGKWGAWRDVVATTARGMVTALKNAVRQLPKYKSNSVFRQWCKQWTKQQHEYSSTQFNLDGNARERVLQWGNSIDDNDVHDKGREDLPHVTVKYGLHGSDAGPVRELVEAFGPVSASMGQVDYFPADQYDVLIVRVDSDDLHRLNALLAQLPHTDTHPEYQPHVTIGYVKPGLGQHYVDMFTGFTDDQQGVFGGDLELTELVFSPADGQPTSIPIAGYAAQEAGALEKGLSFSTVQAAGRWLASKWAALEDRYSRAGALAMATAMIATAPLPGNIAAVIAAAEAIRGVSRLAKEERVAVTDAYEERKSMLERLLEVKK